MLVGDLLEADALLDQLGVLRREFALAQRQDGILLASQRRLIELIAARAPLGETLDQLARAVETQVGGDMLCSVLILDPDGARLRHGAGPSLPRDYVAAIDGTPIGPDVGSCGTAAFLNERVVVSDIMTDPLWANYRGLAQSAGLRACWSTPIRGGSGQVLGTFAMYYRTPRSPDERDLQLIDSMAHLSAIAIEQRRSEDERLRLEAQLQRAQRLESLGLLAGGVAHDFNNLLVSILGQAELALRKLEADAPARPHVAGVEAAARCAAELTGQLLAYTGRGKFLVERLDLSRLIEETTALFSLAVSRRATLRYELSHGLPAIEGDPSQLRQVAMNLFTNASEALGDGAREIHVRSGILEADRDYLAGCILGQELPAGRYVFMEISDTGRGMSRETLSRMFEPFFTTKVTGHGLGLAAVTGILRSHKGAARVTSAPGCGTSFRVLFPALAEATPARSAPRDLAGAVAPARAEERRTILIVDDQPNVRITLRMILEDEGYSVVEGEGGRAALRLLREKGDSIACVLLDMTMPDMTGVETLEGLRAIRGDLPVIVASGYVATDVIAGFETCRPDGFLQKPFTLEELKTALESVLKRPTKTG